MSAIIEEIKKLQEQADNIDTDSCTRSFCNVGCDCHARDSAARAEKKEILEKIEKMKKYLQKNKQETMSAIKFETVKELNINNMKMIPIKTNEDKQLFVKTGKCFSFGVKKDRKFKTTSMSLILGDESLKTLKDIIDQCETHLGRSLTKKLFYGKDEKTIYPKLKPSTKFYEVEGEIDVFKYEEKVCDVKATLEINGILLNGDNVSLQVKVYDALVREHVREEIRHAPTNF